MTNPSSHATIAVIIGLVAWATPAAAEELTGTLMQPSQTAPIRNAPPSGFWRTPGEQIGETTLGTEYYILEQFDVQSGLGASQTWIQVAPVDPATGAVNPDEAGWVYFGENAKTRSLNFDPSVPATQSMNFEPGETVTTRSLAVEPANDTSTEGASSGTRSIIILSPEGN